MDDVGKGLQNNFKNRILNTKVKWKEITHFSGSCGKINQLGVSLFSRFSKSLCYVNAGRKGGCVTLIFFSKSRPRSAENFLFASFWVTCPPKSKSSLLIGLWVSWVNSRRSTMSDSDSIFAQARTRYFFPYLRNLNC